MARTLDLYALIQQPEAQRDAEWERAFFQSIVESQLEIDGGESRVGPDGWPYLFSKTSAVATEPFAKVVEWLAPRGIGLVINAHKMLPDYIFPYGMIWHFVQTGQFIPAPDSSRPREAILEKDKKYIFGPPAESYLPKFVRKVMREFLGAQGIHDPRVLVISSEDYKNIDLVFSVESLGSPEPGQHQAMADALSWFLPLHYSLILASEKDLPKFEAL